MVLEGDIACSEVAFMANATSEQAISPSNTIVDSNTALICSGREENSGVPDVVEASRVDHHGSFETTGNTTISAEGRDEKTSQSRTTYLSQEKASSETTSSSYMQLQHDYDTALATLAVTRQELNEALHEIERVVKKQADCETYLRDVIYQSVSYTHLTLPTKA